jgi:protein-S-isoprenylcysteine O-methyltransferase Ste14
MSEDKDESSKPPEDVKVLSLREDWPLVPYLTTILLGFFVTLYDFIVWQQLDFQVNVLAILGIVFIPIAGVMRSFPRKTLSAAGFGSIWNTPRLKIVKGQKLVTEGYYQHIRHPIYTGEIFRDYCLPLIFSSLYGFLIMTLGIIFLLFRIRIEETLLLEAFDEEYEEYRKRTKKLIPYIY